MSSFNPNPLRGFRDLLGDEAKLIQQLAAKFSQLAESYGYEPVIPPTLERFELFALKSGEEIRKSMYVFRDKAGREVALRPEATASIARIYVRLLRAKPKPIKLYYIVNCFRYEEPQKARYREFWQAGVEYLGGSDIVADFDPIRLMAKFYEEIGLLNKITIKIGTTRLYRTLFNEHGVEEDKQDYILHLMDKKLFNEALDYIHSIGKQELATILEEIWKTPSDTTNAKTLLREFGSKAYTAVDELEQLISMLRSYNEKLSINIDLSFARGLAYYTGIIYEVTTDLLPVSIAGGGRYDNLIELYGGEHVPGTGFAIGLDRTVQALIEAKLGDAIIKKKQKVAVIALDTRYAAYAARIQDIIASRYQTNLIVASKLHKILGKLAEQQYSYAIIIGAKEYDEDKVTIKNLLKREQKTVDREKLIETIINKDDVLNNIA